MTAIALTQFAGEVPRLGVQQLPVAAAAIAENALLLSGELRGLHASRINIDLTSTPYVINRFFRVPEGASGDVWVTFNEKNSHFLKGTLINDIWERYYWTEEGQVPRYNTLARIENGDAPYTLGVPRPATPPTVTPDGLGVAPESITRGYAYTFYSEYGEEGPPTDITLAIGKQDDSWVISGMETTIPDAANRANYTKRLYRTITGELGTVLFFVAEIPLGDAGYTDTATDSAIALNVQLESWSWYPPPVDLEGILSHPNGFMVGFSGRDLYFSDPYRPHAYPPEYVVSTEHPIVGLGIFGASIVVLTEAYPSIASGIHPATMTMSEGEFTEPCLSKFGIVSMPFGVYYPGPNGLMLVNSAGVTNATKAIITKDEWVLNYFPHLIDAARWQDFYVAFYTQGDGFILAPSEPQAAFTQLGNNVWSQQGVQTDAHSGEVYLVDDNRIFTWNPPDGIPLSYRWRSKEYRTPRPINLGAYRIYWDRNTVSTGIINEIILYNTARMSLPLNTFNHHVFNGSDTDPIPTALSAPGMPLGGSPLINAAFGVTTNVLALRVYADGDLVYDYPITDEDMARLPSGYKADRWWFELVGNVAVKSAVFAETGKELARA